MEALGMLLLGAVITMAAQYVKNLSDRDTHASNRILEMRLNALASIWHKFSETLIAIGPSAGLGQKTWYAQYFEATNELRKEFRRETERHQIILDKSVIDALRAIDTEMLLFMDGSYRNKDDDPISFTVWRKEHLDPSLDMLANSINKFMDTSTHTIALKFKEEA